LAKLPTDSRGNLLVFTTLTIASLVGVTGLALDLHRVMALNSELQNAAEPRRVCRRLPILRDWSHDEQDIDEILT
jgi:hypothetical protein